MKKTVNINLAGILFHIDEDAYLKLSGYLEAIRRSLGSTDGNEEIMRDIEARLAELFSENLLSPQHVVGIQLVDDAILIMGQPEDYAEGAEDSEEQQTAFTEEEGYRRYRRLYRDEEDKWIGGVSSGIAHYFGIDPLWIRLLWVLFVIAGVGSPILIYILLWVFVPAALTTADKLRMHGEPINISNIEKKFREGYDNVTSRMKGVNYDKYGNQIKTGTSRFFSGLGNFLVVLLKIFGKILGVFLVLLALSVIVGLIFGLIGISSFGYLSTPDYLSFITFPDSVLPLWLIGILVTLAVGIPFVALFILGLKLIIPHLKPTNSLVTASLSVLWILSLFGLIYVGIEQSQQRAFSGNVVEERPFSINSSDTLNIEMRGNSYYGHDLRKRSGLDLKLDENNRHILFSSDIALILKSTTDSTGRIIIEKSARGRDFLLAKKRAEAVEYHYEVSGNRIILDSFLITDASEKALDQQVKITIFIPESRVLHTGKNVESFLQSSLISRSDVAEFFLVKSESAECISCVEKDSTQTIEKSSPKESWEEEVLEHF